ncbi:MAG TPA: flagellar basal body P-ring protein FlgI [Desulfobacterales bacterium]|nr:flagellar basal body P-ring protein FlgI [Desulfobacterales bacterium]
MWCSRKTAALAPLLLAVAIAAAAAPEVRIKDIAYLRGLRANQVLGIGLVTGLAGKGDSQASGLLKTTLASLVSTFGVDVSAADVRSKNCAVVMVSAELPALAKIGDRIDATVSSIGDARDLDGGVLLQAALLAANGKTYAVAQGRVISTPDNSGVRTVGSVPGGAMVEQDVAAAFVADEVVTVVLRNPDFVTATAVQRAIIAAFPGIQAATPDPSMIEVRMPKDLAADPVAFIARIEALTVVPDTTARVVINSSSGIIVMGEQVRIGKVAVSYRTARVSVGTPSSLSLSSSGANAADPLFVVPDTTSVDDFVSALKAVGLKTEVIIGILQAVERAGALYGTLVVM